MTDRQGLFSAEEQGTILLDEVGDTSGAFQVRLPRVLEERAFHSAAPFRLRPISGLLPPPTAICTSSSKKISSAAISIIASTSSRCAYRRYPNEWKMRRCSSNASSPN
jgi:hypothetical protein